MVKRFLDSYLFSLILILALLLGGLFAYFFKQQVIYLKPAGDIFLNLLFTSIVPLVFFSITSAIARLGSLERLKKIMCNMVVVFLCTSALAALYALMVVKLFPLDALPNLVLNTTQPSEPVNLSQQIVSIFTVPEFFQLLSHQHLLSLILFSLLVGIAAAETKEKSGHFISFLQTGETLFMRVFSLIMYFAPLGFFAYSASLVGELGPQIFETYFHIALTYYIAAALYFFVFFSLYAYLAGGKGGLTIYWQNIFLPAITSLATCSSAASIPANLAATRKMNVPLEISETVIPLGSLIHKDGSVIGGMFKIAFLFSLFQLDFNSGSALIIAFSVSLLVGTVMGAIPSGGMLGELLILNIYGFPPSVLIAIAAISIIIDPPATLLNVTGNSVSSMLVARLSNGKRWLLTGE
ncbi:dicarboxylate/amino acid:cation symporter [Legionella birminghamensis]|uniref:dicarboxylate/amino acid:cation symporter n=1 Tax=Legionella birminghamensis TaxID=28083 RepID=UPI0009F8490A|nr:dicarboxylate/amino acid:cation symporter [Legionella birminghamensis]